MSAFQEFKLAIVTATGLSRDALHLYVGLAIFLALVAGLRRPLHAAGPWLAVLILVLAGELLDLQSDLTASAGVQWAASLHDLVNTMFWPTVLSLLARRGLLAGP